MLVFITFHVFARRKINFFFSYRVPRRAFLLLLFCLCSLFRFPFTEIGCKFTRIVINATLLWNCNFLYHGCLWWLAEVKFTPELLALHTYKGSSSALQRINSPLDLISFTILQLMGICTHCPAW